MKSLLIVFLFLTTVAQLYSQQQTIDSLGTQPNLVARLSILVPGISLENRISAQYTLFCNLWLTETQISISSFNGFTGQSSSSNEFYVRPMFTIEPRFYYSLEQRKAMGKRTDHFSGSYIGFPLTVGQWIDLKDDLTIQKELLIEVGPVYGFQNIFWEYAYWNIEIGFGLRHLPNETTINLLGHFGIGIVLN